MPSFMMVSEAKLSQSPQAFQQYVGEWFVKKEIDGKTYLVAFMHIDLPPNTRKNTGNAPCHSVELMGYKEGLGEKESLSSWIDNVGVKEGFLWKFYGEDRRPWSVLDED